MSKAGTAQITEGTGPQWIKCSDGMPNDLEHVWAYDPTEPEGSRVVPANHYHGDWTRLSTCTEGTHGLHPTHWMRKPEPPR